MAGAGQLWRRADRAEVADLREAWMRQPIVFWMTRRLSRRYTELWRNAMPTVADAIDWEPGRGVAAAADPQTHLQLDSNRNCAIGV